MAKELTVTVKNRFLTDKRDINVYHHSTRSAHIISHHSTVALPLRAVEEDDYLHISAGSSPGNLWRDCVIDVPKWTDFEFSSEGNVTVTHSGERMLVRVPPGPPSWEIKITRPNGLSSSWFSKGDTVAVGDD